MRITNSVRHRVVKRGLRKRQCKHYTHIWFDSSWSIRQFNTQLPGVSPSGIRTLLQITIE
eukprot:SAG31_NODE_843_length_11551_cov_6.757772_11_plen_60_part_00